MNDWAIIFHFISGWTWIATLHYERILVDRRSIGVRHYYRPHILGYMPALHADRGLGPSVSFDKVAVGLST